VTWDESIRLVVAARLGVNDDGAMTTAIQAMNPTASLHKSHDIIPQTTTASFPRKREPILLSCTVAHEE
jgi:hypothetical protein